MIQDRGLLALADDLNTQLCSVAKLVKDGHVKEPSLDAGASSELWESAGSQVSAVRDRVLDLTRALAQLLLGPHAYFHELISSNWDLSALYTILEFDVLEKIPRHGYATTTELAAQTGLPERKLLNILRLASCSNIVEEKEAGCFSHTAFSEELVHDPKFKAFIGFQLYETRVASANLADSLKCSVNSFEHGQSAFKFAFGEPLYHWHQVHEEKGRRFRMAMESVTSSLDPGDKLICDWLCGNNRQQGTDGTKVIDILGGSKISQASLTSKFPNLKFESIAGTEDLGKSSNAENCDQEDVLAYTVRNVFWNKSDQEVVALVKTIVKTLKHGKSNTALLINEMLSPDLGQFEGDLETAFRRRDVTVMTMHNAKQRRETEWRELFAMADPSLKVHLATAYSSHSYRGLWELRI